jgi:hypothetical protein
MTFKSVVCGTKSIAILTNYIEMEETECFVCGTGIHDHREAMSQANEESLNA